MTPRACPHETDVLDLVAIEQWPQRSDASLQAHVAGCPQCAEVASIATAVREWDDAAPLPRVPEASVVWHRARVKARTAAAHTASRPVSAAQCCAVIAFIVALVWIGPSASWYASVWQSVSTSVPTVSIRMPDVALWPSVLSVSELPPGWGWSAGLWLAGVVLLVSLVIGALGISEHSEIPNNK